MPDERTHAFGLHAETERAVAVQLRERSEDPARGSAVIQRSAPRPSLESLQPTLLDYFAILKKRKNLGLAVFFSILSVVALYTFLVTPTYRSMAVLLIQNRAPRDVDPKTREDNEAVFQRYVETELGILKSRALAEELVTKMHLAESPDFVPSRSRWLSWIRTQLTSLFTTDNGNAAELARIKRENQAVKAVQQRLSVKQLAKSQLLEVSIDAGTPGLAQSLVKTYLDIYLDAKQKIERKTTLASLHWLKDELEKVQFAVLESESALVKFVAEHGIVPSDDGGLAEVVDMIKKKRDGVIKAQELEAKLQGLKGGASQTARFNVKTDGLDDEMLRKLKDSLATLETEYTQATAAFSPDSPRAMLLRRRMHDLERRIATIQNQSVTSALKAAQREADVLTTGLAQAKKEAIRVGSLGAQYAILKKEVDTNKELHKILLRDYKETHIKSRTAQTPISIVDPPTMPSEPVWPRKSLFLIIGTLLSGVGAVLVVLAAHFVEDGWVAADQVEREFNVAKLGTVPDASKLKELHGAGNSSYEFLPYDLPHSPVADSIRTIHASILFSASGQEDVVRSVVISSATAGEGKTFIAVSLATALTCNSSKQTCSSSKRILVVDCDLRRPSIHTVFRARLNDAGLTTLLTSDRLSVDNVIRRHHIPGLFYMTAGPMVPDPVPLLMSERFGEIVSELHNKFDFIIFDSPPILGFPEIRILSPHSDGLVLVVERGRTDQFELRSAATVISSIRNSRILGLVMNKTRPYRSQYLYSGSYYARDRSAARTPK